MSDELPQGAVSLEEEQAPVAAPPVTEPPPPPANPEDAEPEGTIVNPGGEKLVPLSALAAARAATRAAKEEAAALRPKAEQADRIAQEWQSVQPLIQRVRDAQHQQTPPPPKPEGPLTPDEAVEYAKYLDLYDTEGKPDTGRAQRVAVLNARVAEKQAQQYVQPLIQHTAEGQSRQNFETAANFKDAAGHSVDRGILQGIWSQVPAEMSAQPNIAAVLYRQAIAEMVIQGKYKGAAPPPPPPPVHTEGVGGGNAPAQTLNSIDHQFRAASDMTEKAFTTIREKYQPGRTNSLE